MLEVKKVKELREVLRAMTITQLKDREKQLRRTIFEIINQHACKKGMPFVKSHLTKKYKKEIARIITILKEKENELQKFYKL